MSRTGDITPGENQICRSRTNQWFDWRALRHALGLTQAQMASIMCIHKVEMSRLERGVRRRPMPAVMIILRAFLSTQAMSDRLRESDYTGPWPWEAR